MKPKTLQVSFSDGSEWEIPVEVIARDRAAWYAEDYGDDVERSLAEDTLPLFEEDDFEILDWATNEMNWSDLAPHAVRVPTPSKVVDYEAEWGDVPKTVIGEWSNLTA